MQTRTSTSSTVLLVILVLLTFPLWIGILGGVFGLIAGVFGAFIGVVAGIFGAVMGILGAIFGWAFDWHMPWNFHFFPNFGVFVFITILLLVMLTRRKGTTK